MNRPAHILPKVFGAAAMVSLLACVTDGTNIAPLRPPSPDASAPPADSGTIGPIGADAESTCVATQQLCGAQCVNLKDDAAHCGNCDHACGGGSCSNGVCQAVELAKGLDAPTAVAVAGATAVVALATRMVRCSVSGQGCGTSTPLWSDNAITMQVGTIGLLTDNGLHAYGLGSALSRQRLYQADVNSASVPTVPVVMTPGVVGLPNIAHMAIDEREWVGISPTRAFRCFRDQCSSQGVLKDGGSPVAIAMSPTHYVYSRAGASDALRACARPAAGLTAYVDADCGLETILADATPGWRPIDRLLTVVGNTAFWVEASGSAARVLGCKISGCNKTPVIIAEEDAPIDALAADPSGVFWSQRTSGRLRTCSQLAGCGTAAQTLTDGKNNPTALALDRNTVYFVTGGAGSLTGQLFKIAK